MGEKVKSQKYIEPKIVLLKSWGERFSKKELKDNHFDSDKVITAYDRGNNIIYALKKYIKPYQLEHERYHAIKYQENPRKYRKPLSPDEYIREEFEAEKYAYKKTGKPKSIYSAIGVLCHDLYNREYKLTPIEASNIIEKQLKARRPPKQWIDDFNRYDKHVQKAVGYKKYQRAEKIINKLVKENPRTRKDWWDDDFYTKKIKILRSKEKHPSAILDGKL